MLCTQTVAATTFELLKKLQAEPALGMSCLTGTMALSLHLGHLPGRNAELLLPDVFSWELLEELLRDNYGFQGHREDDGLRGHIGEPEFFLYEQRHTLVSRPVEEAGLRLCGLGDLAAGILRDIETDSTREASFAELACLSARLSLNAILSCYERKYPSSNVVGAVKALLYFNDIERNGGAVADARLRIHVGSSGRTDSGDGRCAGQGLRGISVPVAAETEGRVRS